MKTMLWLIWNLTKTAFCVCVGWTIAILFLTLIYASPASAAWTKKNDQTGTATSTSVGTTAFSSALTNPSLIIVYGSTLNTAALSVTDTAGNTYYDCFGGATAAPVLYNSSADQLECFFAVNSNTTASNVVTLHDATSSTLRVVAQEWTGGNVTGVQIEAANQSSGTGGGQNVSSGSATTLYANLLVGMAAAVTVTLTVNSSFTTSTFSGMEYLTQASGGAQAATWSDNTNSDGYAALEVTFNPIGGAFTAAQTGDWQSTATWGTSGSGCHVAYPCMTDSSKPGDTVTIPDNFTVSCGTGETCSAGNSPSTNAFTNTAAVQVTHVSGDSGGLSMVGTATLVHAGNIVFDGGTFAAAGAKIYCDTSWSSAPITALYVVQLGDLSSPNGERFNFTGTSATPILDEGDAFDSPLKDSSTCTSAGNCLGGGVGPGSTGDIENDMNTGTLNYVNFQDFGVDPPSAATRSRSTRHRLRRTCR